MSSRGFWHKPESLCNFPDLSTNGCSGVFFFVFLFFFFFCFVFYFFFFFFRSSFVFVSLCSFAMCFFFFFFVFFFFFFFLFFFFLCLFFQIPSHIFKFIVKQIVPFPYLVIANNQLRNKPSFLLLKSFETKFNINNFRVLKLPAIIQLVTCLWIIFYHLCEQRISEGFQQNCTMYDLQICRVVLFL